MRELLSKHVFPDETVTNWYVGFIIFGIVLLFAEGFLLLGAFALETGIIGSVASGLLLDFVWLVGITKWRTVK